MDINAEIDSIMRLDQITAVVTVIGIWALLIGYFFIGDIINWMGV